MLACTMIFQYDVCKFLWIYTRTAMLISVCAMCDSNEPGRRKDKLFLLGSYDWGCKMLVWSPVCACSSPKHFAVIMHSCARLLAVFCWRMLLASLQSLAINVDVRFVDLGSWFAIACWVFVLVVFRFLTQTRNALSHSVVDYQNMLFANTSATGQRQCAHGSMYLLHCIMYYAWDTLKRSVL